MKKRSILMNVVLAATLGFLSISGAKAQTGGNYSWWTKANHPGSFLLQSGTANGELSGAYEWFGGAPGAVDTVTIGARVPYFIEGDPTIDGYVNATPAKLNPSQFKWVFTKTLGGTVGAYTPASDTLDLIVNQGLSKTPAEKSEVAFTGWIGGSYVPAANLKGKGYYNVGTSTEVSAFTPALDLAKGMKEINVKFAPGITSTPASVGTAGLKVGDEIHLLSNEIAVTTAGVPMCEGVDGSTGIGDSVAVIKVIDKPELKWMNSTHNDVVACSTDSLTFGGLTKIYGYGPFVVRYQIEAGTYDASTSTFTPASPATSSIDSTLFGTAKDVYPYVDASSPAYEYLFLPGSAFNATATTTYRVTFLGVTDRFSRKSLDYIPGTIPGGDAIGAGTSGDPSFVINVIDAPKTKKLKHVKNNRG
ncbi:MAG: hypothetical protein LBU62_09660 [Bacteroidales bacterium]|jgi:hypothetical protein|nr:hypothetical protein [Bacteroidales bacterium]